MKRIKLEFRTKHTENYVLDKCLSCVTEDDAMNMGCISSEESVKDNEGLREVMIEFEIEDEIHFISELQKQKVYQTLTSLNFVYGVEPIHWTTAIDSMFSK